MPRYSLIVYTAQTVAIYRTELWGGLVANNHDDETWPCVVRSSNKMRHRGHLKALSVAKYNASWRERRSIISMSFFSKMVGSDHVLQVARVHDGRHCTRRPATAPRPGPRRPRHAPLRPLHRVQPRCIGACGVEYRRGGEEVRSCGMYCTLQNRQNRRGLCLNLESW